MAAARKMILWTGPTHSGKTTAARGLIEHLRMEGFTVAGLLAPAVYEGGILAGFDALDISTGRRCALLRRRQGGAGEAGPFAFNNDGLPAGRAALTCEAAKRADLVVVDEFGPLELGGGGWRGAVDSLAGSAAGMILLVVRDRIAEQARQTYAALDPVLIGAAEPDAMEAVVEILRKASR